MWCLNPLTSPFSILTQSSSTHLRKPCRAQWPRALWAEQIFEADSFSCGPWKAPLGLQHPYTGHLPALSPSLERPLHPGDVYLILEFCCPPRCPLCRTQNGSKIALTGATCDSGKCRRIICPWQFPGVQIFPPQEQFFPCHQSNSWAWLSGSFISWQS